MSVLLDTNVLIGLLRGSQPHWQYLEKLLEKTAVSISAVTHAEIYAGCHPSEEAETEKLITLFKTVPVDKNIAEMAGRFVYRFKRRGVTLHLEDALIGATALNAHLILATSNVSHFPMLSLDRDLIRFPNE